MPIVTYVNTSADVKAESDICCTSSNAVAVVESFGVDTVLLIPDEFLAQNVALQTDVKILTWKGHCEVHERLTAAELLAYKEADPSIQIIAHPECPVEVTAVADFDRLHFRHDRLCRAAEAGCEGAAGARNAPWPPTFRNRRRASSSSSPATCAPHEAHHPAQDSRQLAGDEGRGAGRPADGEKARRAVERMVNLKN